MTLTVIIKVIGIGLIHIELIWGRVIKGQFSRDFGLEHIIFNSISNGDGKEIHK